MKITLLIFSLVLIIPINAQKENNWPQPAGPNGDWTLQTNYDVLTEFSVTTGNNILWKAELPEGGQSGIAIWNNMIFLTVMKPCF